MRRGPPEPTWAVDGDACSVRTTGVTYASLLTKSRLDRSFFSMLSPFRTDGVGFQEIEGGELLKE